MADIVNARDALLQAAQVRVNGVTMQPNITVPLDNIEGAGLIIEGTRLVYLKASSQVFQIPKVGATSPETATITLETKNVSGTVALSVVSGQLNFVPTFTNNMVVIAHTQMITDVVTLRASVVMVNNEGDNIEYYDEVTLAKVREGIDSITGFLTNENHTLPADHLGNVTSYSGCNGQFKVYQGINDVTTACTFELVEGTNPRGMTINIAPAGTLAGQYSLSSGYPTDTEAQTVVFRAKFGSAIIDKTFTISKSKSGKVGTDGERGSRSFYVSTNNTTWSNTLATQTVEAQEGPVLMDTVTEFNNAAGFSETRYWDGQGWIVVNAVIDGNLLVTRTVGAQHMVANLMQSDNTLTRGLTVRDMDGNIILAAGIPLDYSNVKNGPQIPADNVAVPEIPMTGSGVEITNGAAKKTGTTAAWDAHAYTQNSITGRCFMAGIARATNKHVALGLSTNPAASADVSNLDYAWYLDAGGKLRIMEKGVFVTEGSVVTPNPNQTTSFRYIRDYLNGNTINDGNHWCELRVFDVNGVNIAQGKNVTANFTPSYGALQIATDGNSASSPYINGQTGEQYIQVDLGSVQAVKSITVWHYYDDARTYRMHRIEVSQDGQTWTKLFDSAVSGTHTETAAGFTISAPFSGSTAPAPGPSPSPGTGLSGVFHMGMHCHRLYNNGGESGTPSPNPTFRWGLFRDWDCENIQDAVIWDSDGSIDFSLVTQVYQAHAARGAKVLKCFGTVPTWASRRPTEANIRYPSWPGSMSGPRDFAEYKAYCKAFITTMRQYIWAVEGWNEPYPSTASSSDPEWPQFTTMTLTQLADTQKALYQAAKEVDPNIPVFSPAQAYVSGIDDLLSARTSQNEPISNFFDVLAWHPYNRSASGFEGITLQYEAERVRGILTQFNISKPLADTEHGWLGGGKEGAAQWYSMTAAQRAQILYDTAVKARDIGLVALCYYSYETDLLGQPAYNSTTAAALDRAFLDLETGF